MQTLYRSGSTAYGREGNRYYIMTGYAASGGRYTCETCDEVPEKLQDLIGPIVNIVSVQQRRIIEAAGEVYAPENHKPLPTKDREKLIRRMVDAIDAEPDQLHTVLHLINRQHPLIVKLERDFRAERRIPTQNCPFTTRERVEFELEVFERIMSELWLYYGQQKTD